MTGPLLVEDGDSDIQSVVAGTESDPLRIVQPNPYTYANVDAWHQQDSAKRDCPEERNSEAENSFSWALILSGLPGSAVLRGWCVNGVKGGWGIIWFFRL